MSEKKTRRQKTAEREAQSMPKIKEQAKKLKEKGEIKLLEKKLRDAVTRKPTVEQRLHEAEKQINKWKEEEREEEADILPLDTSMGQKYDDEGNLIEIEAADGGYIKKYAHGGGVRKAKFMDS